MRKTALLPAALACLAAAAAPAATASATAFNNEDGTVRCDHYEAADGTTICVSDLARPNQPECNPPGILAPAVSIEREWVGVKCWNQGQTSEPEYLPPMSVRHYGQIVAFAAPGGDVYVFDTERFALIKSGATNQVLFPGVNR